MKQIPKQMQNVIENKANNKKMEICGEKAESLGLNFLD